LFVGTLLFHRRLYELRPKGENSGLFYVILALGGALGGCFNTFIAPQIFRTAVEFPLVLALSLLVILLPDFLAMNVLREKRFPKQIALLLLVLLPGAALYISSSHSLFDGWRLAISGSLLTLVLLAFFLLLDWFYQTLQRVALAILISGLLGGCQATASDGSWIHAERNFFGISRVREDTEHARRVYSHGMTMHGWQSTEEQRRLDPGTTYYGPLRDIVAHLPASVVDAPIAALGLGIGTVACYAKRAQEMDFYEIDPASIHIAREPAYFTYLRDCPGKRSIILGDGRITLNKAPDGRYGFIIMDAFTSDAIPMHLLTLEALRMYGEKMRPDGLIAFNISNRYLNLVPVFRTLARELGWAGRYRHNLARKNSLELSSIWIVLAKHEKSLEPLEHLPQWQPLPPEEGKQYRWTDDYTNLLSVLRFSRGPEFEG
jgi:spermidine synthase